MSDVFSNIKIYPAKTSSPKILANGSVLVSGVVEVKFTVMQGTHGPFASLPARKGSKPGEDGKIPWYSDVRIPNDDLYKELQSLVRAEYTKVIGGQSGQSEAGEESQVTDGIPF